jgi:hypothetical protein
MDSESCFAGLRCLPEQFGGMEPNSETAFSWKAASKAPAEEKSLTRHPFSSPAGSQELYLLTNEYAFSY